MKIKFAKFYFDGSEGTETQQIHFWENDKKQIFIGIKDYTSDFEDGFIVLSPEKIREVCYVLNELAKGIEDE